MADDTDDRRARVTPTGKDLTNARSLNSPTSRNNASSASD